MAAATPVSFCTDAKSGDPRVETRTGDGRKLGSTQGWNFFRGWCNFELVSAWRVGGRTAGWKDSLQQSSWRDERVPGSCRLAHRIAKHTH